MWLRLILSAAHRFLNLGFKKNQQATGNQGYTTHGYIHSKYWVSSVRVTFENNVVVGPILLQFSVPQIEYPLGGSSKKGSDVYFMLIVAIVTSGHHGCIRRIFISNNSTIWQNNNITQNTCNRKYTWLPFCLCLLVDILFEVLRIVILMEVVIFCF